MPPLASPDCAAAWSRNPDRAACFLATSAPAVSLRSVRRFHLAPALFDLLMIVAPAGASSIQEQMDEAPEGPAAAVPLPDEIPIEEDAAGMLRYLVPPLLAFIAITLVGVVACGGFGAKGRCRVVR